MKLKIISICLVLFSVIYAETYNSNSTKLFSGSIEFPEKALYDLCLFYNGQKLEFESTTNSNFIQFSFLDHKDIRTIYFLITNGLTCCTTESNNIDCLHVADEKSYICYQLQAKRETNTDMHDILSWNISEHTLQQGQVPQNSLIFLFEPSLISGLKVTSWKPENLFRIIPTLLINPHATKKELQRACDVARLAAMDIDRIHAKTAMTDANKAHAILTALQ